MRSVFCHLTLQHFYVTKHLLQIAFLGLYIILYDTELGRFYIANSHQYSPSPTCFIFLHVLPPPDKLCILLIYLVCGLCPPPEYQLHEQQLCLFSPCWFSKARIRTHCMLPSPSRLKAQTSLIMSQLTSSRISGSKGMEIFKAFYMFPKWSSK